MSTSRERPLWKEFYDLDPSDPKTVERLKVERGLVPNHVYLDLIEGSAREGSSRDDLLASWTWEPSFQHEHRLFRGVVDTLTGGGADTDQALYGLNHALLGASRPRVDRSDKQGTFEFVTNPGYTTMGDVYLSFAQDLAHGIVSACPRCGKAFQMSPKQLGARSRGREHFFDTEACRIGYTEALPERIRQKREAARKSYEAHKHESWRKAKARRGRSG